MNNKNFKNEISSVINDGNKTKDDKISQLLSMYQLARAEQRAVTEGGVIGEDNDEENNLREVELALQELGVDASDPDEKGAATL